MKTKNLLPNRWKPFGWALLSAASILLVSALLNEGQPLFDWTATIPWPFEAKEAGLLSVFQGFEYSKDGTITLQLMDELSSLCVIAGLLIVGFSRIKNEDERTAQMRLESLQWAIYGNTLILILCVIFIYGLDFLDVMIFNMFTPLLIFVLRFHWLLYKESKVAGAPEGKIMAL